MISRSVPIALMTISQPFVPLRSSASAALLAKVLGISLSRITTVNSVPASKSGGRNGGGGRTRGSAAARGRWRSRAWPSVDHRLPFMCPSLRPEPGNQRRGDREAPDDDRPRAEDRGNEQERGGDRRDERPRGRLRRGLAH